MLKNWVLPGRCWEISVLGDRVELIPEREWLRVGLQPKSKWTSSHQQSRIRRLETPRGKVT